MARRTRPQPRSPGPEPGRPATRRGPDAADVAAEYLDAPPASQRQQAFDGDPFDMASGSVDDQMVYEGLAENGGDMPPVADPRRRRQRSPVASRSAPAPRPKRQRKTKR